MKRSQPNSFSRKAKQSMCVCHAIANYKATAPHKQTASRPALDSNADYLRTLVPHLSRCFRSYNRSKYKVTTTNCSTWNVNSMVLLLASYK